MKSVFYITLLLLLFGCGLGRSQTNLRVRLIYLQNGKPAANQRIVLYEGDPSRSSTAQIEGTTAADGTATFRLAAPLPKSVWVYESNGKIEGCAWENQLPVDVIIRRGVTVGVDERYGSRCKGDRALIDSLVPGPGEIVMFVRKLTVWDGLRRY